MAAHLPAWLARNAGDTLWAANLYFVFAFIRPSAAPVRLLFATITASFAVEFGQLYQAEWIEALRATRLGALVLGFDFIWIDLVRYTVGALLALLIDRCLFRKTRGE